MTNPQQPINPITIDSKNLQFEKQIKSREQHRQSNYSPLASEKQQQSSRNPQHGQKDDNDIEQNNKLIGNAINSDATSMADNKDSNDKYKPNSYI